MPFAISYNGSNVVGSAGMGWDIPLAGVTWQRNISRRKPVHRFQGQAEPTTADRILVDMGSGPMVMAPTSTPGVYQPLGNGFYELHASARGMTGRDASGRQWSFQKIPALLDDDFFALVSIADSTGMNRVDFRYDVYDRFSPDPVQPPYTSAKASMREVLLREITHSYVVSPSPTPNVRLCPKYRIQLDYTTWQGLNYPVEYPNLLSVDFSAGRPRAHTRLIQRIQVRSNTDASCLPLLLPIDRTYVISYASDELTGQPRLQKVDWFGTNDDATNPATGLPVVGYQYGSPITAGGLRFAAAEWLTLPGGPAGTPSDGFAASFGTGAGSVYGFVRGFQDFDGDGRADFVTLGSAHVPVLAINQASNLGNDFSTFPSQVTLPNTPGAPYNLGAPDFMFKLPVLEAIDNTYQEVIDFNGDGRPDILMATEGRNPDGHLDPNFWKLLVNTPGPTGAPSDIRWLERQIDVADVRLAIQSRHVLSLTASSDQRSKPLPLGRTMQVGAIANNVSVESGVITQWKLIDVNGDGFPDMVFDDEAVTAFNDTSCDPSGTCRKVLRQDHPRTNRLMVIYHTGPMMAGSGAETQNRWRGPAVALRNDGACGVERLTWQGGGIRRLSCGFMEVNGDGIPDYVVHDARGIRAIRSPGLPEAYDVRLPENEVPHPYAQQEKKRSILLPGPVGVVKDPHVSVCGSSGTKLYKIEQQTALRDLTGDGIADYVYFGTRGALSDKTAVFHPSLKAADAEGPEGWWLMPGTGVGFAAPIPIHSPPEAPFALHVSNERCDGQVSSVVAALQDVDGDGRLELLRGGRFSTLRIAKIVDGAGELGAHSAGQLTAIDNRYGAVTHVKYGSAKSSWIAHGAYPAPEIVVTQTERTADRGLGTSMAPVQYAYGNAEIIYQPALGRWMFGGYRRRVTLWGEPTPNTNFLKGRATVVDAVSVRELGDDLAKVMLTGRPHDVMLVASATIPADPRFLLGSGAPPALRLSNDHTEWKTQALPGPVPPFVPLEDECYAPPPPQSPGAFGDLVFCRRAATAYVNEHNDWEGTHPYPAFDSVATRTVITAVDDYARPTRITSEGDRFRADDDTCLQIDYASSVNGGTPPLNAPRAMRVTECGNPAHVLSGERYLYDGLPEGQVGGGFPSGRILERYDVQTGALLDQSSTYSIERDDFGNPVRFTRTRPDGATSATTIAYDPFGIMPVRTETSATGLLRPIVTQATRDRQTLLPLVVWSEQGSATYNTFDKFGRLTRVSLSVPGDATHYVLSETAFQGFESGPRSVRYRAYSQWTPEANAPNADPRTVDTYTQMLDEMGRPIHAMVDLGADYGGQSLIVNAVIYDPLGRPKFQAAPFPSVEFGEHYGTTFTYRADGRAACAIEGQGVQTSATTDETADRYPTCMSYLYAGHQALIKTQGPNELATGKPQSGAYDEVALGATGLLLQGSRAQGQARLEQVDYAYDRLGQASAVTRWANPQDGTGPVRWSWAKDSLGNVLTATEPAGISRRYTQDAWGNVTKVRWTDSTGNVPVERGVNFAYDGLGRLVSTRETTNGAEQPQTAKEYFYDAPSGQPQHLDTQFLLGRLSWTRGGGRSVFFGYDALGRLTTTSRADAGSSQFYAERKVLGPAGEVARLDLLLPGGANTPEQIEYDYDSARRMKAVRFRDATGTNELWRAMEIDPFGRPLQVKLGNGATESAAFRADHRRELMERRTDSGTNMRLVRYGAYDGEMLLKSLSAINGLAEPATSVQTTYSYDARSALQRAIVQTPTALLSDWSYEYDGLGNLTRITDEVGSGSAELRPDPLDRDRLCAVVPQGSPATPCTYRYDALGNVRSVNGAAYRYEASGRMRSATTGARRVQMQYDPFGAMSSMRSSDGTLERRQQFYGGVTQVGFFNSSGQPVTVGTGSDAFQSFVERQIQSPQGTVAVVRKSNTGTAAILYPVGERQGTRVVLSANGSASQLISYAPYGEVLSDSQGPSALTWWPYQWNGGHALEGLGLVVVGQRVLDGATGRFLQRDPAINFTTATTAHPYSFAWNNPVRFTDPTGADPQPDEGGAVDGSAAPGANIDPYIDMQLTCGKAHDCMSAIEAKYPLTSYEQDLKEAFKIGRKELGAYEYYRVVLDRVSGDLLGYAFFDNNLRIFDRSGRVVATLNNERPLESPLFSPIDLAIGPLSGALRGAFGRIAARSLATATEEAVIDEVTSEGEIMAARRAPPYKFTSRLPRKTLGVTNLRTGEIFINSSLTPGTKTFTETLFHEAVHSWFTPTRGLWLTVRQNARIWFYFNSHLLKFAEEGLAETWGTLNPIKGVVYGYRRVNPLRLVLEGSAYGGGIYGSYRLGQDIRGGWDSP